MRGRNTPFSLILAATSLMSTSAIAVEGGVGRPITGQQVFSNAGIIPPEPGTVVSITSIHYDAKLKGSRPVPINGEISAGLDMKISYTMANFTHVWDTGKGRWNFASAIGLPVQDTEIDASLTGPRGRTLGQNDSGTQFADLLITPFAAGYHFSATDHISFSLPIYLPTGAYNENRLANAGQNTYTFMPTVAFTHLDGKGGEFSLMSALELYTRNEATEYRNGSVFTLDGLWTLGLGEGWSAGVVGGLIKQLTDDKGDAADALNGFRGHSYGAGPVVGWSGKFSDVQTSVNLRWVPEFHSEKRPEGDAVSLNLTMLFL